MNTTTFESVQVGDKVWSVLYGWGVVSEVSKGSAYPLRAHFQGGVRRWYTSEGKQYKTHVSQILFWDEVKIEAPKKPLPDLEVDAKIFVWDDPRRKFKGHFSHFDENGGICVFMDGRTSFSSECDTELWKYWELAE